MENKKVNIGQMCTQCDDKNKAVNFCGDCGEYICTDCTNAHKRTRLTKEHKLERVNLQHETNKQNSSTASKHPFCRNKRHTDKEVNMFCENCRRDICELCASEQHNEHTVRPLLQIFQEQHAYLTTLVSELKHSDLQVLSTRLETSIKEQKEKSAKLKTSVFNQFEIYSKILKDRSNFLRLKIEETSENIIDRLERDMELVKKGKDDVSDANALLKETNATAFLKSSQHIIESLKQFRKNIPKMNDAGDLNYNQACTTEDFNRIVQALGSIQEDKKDINMNKKPDTSGELHSVTSVPVESTHSDQLMELLKSLTTALVDENSLPQSHKPSKLDSGDSVTLASLNKSAGCIIQNPVSVVVKNVARGMRDLLQSRNVKDMVAMRFQTWGLKGYWRVEDENVEMFSNTLQECEQCMQILKDVVLKKTLKLRKGTAFIVESDKWQIVTGLLKRKYPNQVEIDIDHGENTVAIYSTCTTVMKDACDALHNFLRDNQVKKITLHYDEPIVSYVMRKERKLKKIKQCLSQYCIQISSVDYKSIVLKGIGFGLSQAVKMIHEMALKFSIPEEKRFDSDPEGDDDEEEHRFSDDEQVQAETAVQIDLDVDAEDKKVDITALCFQGDDKVIYVVAGDITELPTEVLVNAADKTLKHNGGLAKVLIQKGGRSIQEECTDHVQKHGNVSEGRVYCSGAGNMLCSMIIHAVGPKWKDGTSNEREKLYECVTSCMSNASMRKVASLAFPAISAGTFKFPLKVATFTIVKAVKDFLLEQPRCSIREIYLCDKAVETADAFATSVREIFKECDIVVSNGMQDVQEAEPVQAASNRCDVRKLFVI